MQSQNEQTEQVRQNDLDQLRIFSDRCASFTAEIAANSAVVSESNQDAFSNLNVARSHLKAANMLLTNIQADDEFSAVSQDPIVGKQETLELNPNVSTEPISKTALAPASTITSKNPYDWSLEQGIRAYSGRVQSLSQSRVLPHDEIIAAVPAEKREQIKSAWEQLDNQQRGALVLANFYSAPIEQIASVLKVHPISAARILRSALNVTQLHMAPSRVTTRPIVKVEQPKQNQGRHILLNKPYTALLTDDKSKPLTGRVSLEALEFNGGNVAIANLKTPTRQAAKCAILAATGLSNAEIKSLLFISEDTVKTHLRRIYESYSITNRASIASRFVEKQIFKIIEPGKELRLSEQEQEIASRISQGMGDLAISKAVFLALHTVRARVHKINQNNGFARREQLALAYLMSGNKGSSDVNVEAQNDIS